MLRRDGWKFGLFVEGTDVEGAVALIDNGGKLVLIHSSHSIRVDTDSVWLRVSIMLSDVARWEFEWSEWSECVVTAQPDDILPKPLAPCFNCTVRLPILPHCTEKAIGNWQEYLALSYCVATTSKVCEGIQADRTTDSMYRVLGRSTRCQVLEKEKSRVPRAMSSQEHARAFFWGGGCDALNPGWKILVCAQ
jgi:hypothetical protein